MRNVTSNESAPNRTEKYEGLSAAGIKRRGDEGEKPKKKSFDHSGNQKKS